LRFLILQKSKFETSIERPKAKSVSVSGGSVPFLTRGSAPGPRSLGAPLQDPRYRFALQRSP